MKALSSIYLVALLLVQAVLAQDREVPELKILLSSYEIKRETLAEVEFDSALEELDAKYRGALERAQGSAQKSGKLEDSVAFRDEVDQLTSGFVEEKDTANLPPTLKSLRSVYINSRTQLESRRAAKLAPLKRKMGQSLDQLIVTLTKEGRLEDALAVKQARVEFSDVGSSIMVAAKKELSEEEKLVEWLQGRELYWDGTNADELVLRFDDNEVTVFADGKDISKSEFKVLSPLVLQFEWAANGLNTITLESDKRSFMRSYGNGGGHSGECATPIGA